MFRLFLAILALGLSGALCAQTGERGSTPPGQSRDGAAPSDGAIKGGTILPGESSGMPDKSVGVPDRTVAQKRCEELSGTLREDCLKQEGEAASGETRLPSLPSDIRRPPKAPAD